MATILNEIVERKLDYLETAKREMPLASIQDDLSASDRDFAAALRNPSPAFILECKKASPSAGLIRPDFDLKKIASVYGQFASAISVLTEHEYFQGSMADLRTVREAVSQPVICKDFIVDPYQVYLARRHGADAILLILAVLEDDHYANLSETARSLGMDVLTEVADESEQQRAIELRAPIVGINNRNLHDFSIDLNTTRQLAKGLEDSIVISESGFRSHRQIREMSQHANGFLVGSSLMGEADLGLAVRKLIFGENKICGLTRVQDAMVAAESGTVYGGLIFAPSSPRRVDMATAEKIVGATSLRFVGVFQDQSIEELAAAANRLSLFSVQLHGDESPEYVSQLRQQLGTGCEIWRAVSVDSVEPWMEVPVDRLVVDNQSGPKKGGTGTSFDWNQLPQTGRDRIMLAGGLSASNASQAASLDCAGLDFNSGVESSPGVKDERKIRELFATLRQI